MKKFLEQLQNAFIAWYNMRNERERRLFVATIICVIAVLLFLIFEPLFSRLGQIRADIVLAQQELIKARKQYKQYMELKESSAELWERVSSAGDEREEPIKFRSRIKDLADKANLTISRWGQVISEEKDGFVEYSISLNATCDLETLTKFLYELSNSDKLLDVRELKLRGTTRFISGQPNYQVTADFTIATLVLRGRGQ